MSILLSVSRYDFIPIPVMQFNDRILCMIEVILQYNANEFCGFHAFYFIMLHVLLTMIGKWRLANYSFMIICNWIWIYLMSLVYANSVMCACLFRWIHCLSDRAPRKSSVLLKGFTLNKYIWNEKGPCPNYQVIKKTSHNNVLIECCALSCKCLVGLAEMYWICIHLLEAYSA